MSSSLRWKPIFLGGTLGVACTLLALYALNSARHVYHLTSPSTEATSQPLQRAGVDPSWIKSGEPNFRVAVYAQDPNSMSGIWACDGPTTFEWHFPHDEQVYILEGSVNIDYMGSRFTLKPGETAQFLAGTKAVWHVPDSLKKSFTIRRPSRMVRLYRSMFGVV